MLWFCCTIYDRYENIYQLLSNLNRSRIMNSGVVSEQSSRNEEKPQKDSTLKPLSTSKILRR